MEKAKEEYVHKIKFPVHWLSVQEKEILCVPSAGVEQKQKDPTLAQTHEKPLDLKVMEKANEEDINKIEFPVYLSTALRERDPVCAISSSGAEAKGPYPSPDP